jgi:hypothetical protein
MATITLDSVPRGATVTDLTTNKQIGKTPFHFSVPGSKAPRQFGFHLHGFSDTTVELMPNRATIDYSETLQKGAAGTAVVHKVADPTLKTVPVLAGSNTGSNAGAGSAVTRPEPASGSAVTRPEAGSAAKPNDVGSAAKPPEVKPPPKDDCPESEDGLPCLKKNVPGLAGSGSGT